MPIASCVASHAEKIWEGRLPAIEKNINWHCQTNWFASNDYSLAGPSRQDYKFSHIGRPAADGRRRDLRYSPTAHHKLLISAKVFPLLDQVSLRLFHSSRFWALSSSCRSPWARHSSASWGEHVLFLHLGFREMLIWLIGVAAYELRGRTFPTSI